MTSTKYIGLDVHKESISIVVMNSVGKVVMECVIETKASTILQFIDGLRGDVRVTFEEGTWAAWLYDLLKPRVTEVVVCNPRKAALLKDGSKGDRIDAYKLAELLYMNGIKSVYHGEHGLRTMKELARSYLTISADLTRVMNRLKSLYRSWGIPCAGTEVYDFLGFSYGFRPRHSQHQALDALSYALLRKKVNYVLDADIRGFFDNLDKSWLIKFVEHRVADPRILRLIQKWLNAGVMEEGKWSEMKTGTPQGSVISPTLANTYLHYVFDLWVDVWRAKCAQGDVVVVRYADDIVLGFQHQTEADRFLEKFRERLGKFGLELHPDKTRRIEFGRYAEQNRKRRGEGV